MIHESKIEMQSTRNIENDSAVRRQHGSHMLRKLSGRKLISRIGLHRHEVCCLSTFHVFTAASEPSAEKPSRTARITKPTIYDTIREETKMLVLSRKVGQRLVIDDNITIVINRITGNRVQIGIEAPNDVHIMRGELDKIRRQFSDSDQALQQEAVSMALRAEFSSAPEIPSRSSR